PRGRRLKMSASWQCSFLMVLTSSIPQRQPFAYDFFMQSLGQHRTIWQEHSAKDFASYESYKRAGILYVFPPFITARMGQKIGRRPQTQLCGDALDFFRGCPYAFWVR